ncbi:cytidine deaminase [Streptococcus pneumoniae GA41410]|nr:cytidine deaminase [Streptococcus pneumoniae GA41410]
MSRKGNSQDNGMMESFFGILKSEMFYGYEKSFQSLKQLEQAIVDYLDSYFIRLVRNLVHFIIDDGTN